MPAVIDNRTPNFDLELPHVSNIQTDDVARLRSAFGKIDAELQSGVDAMTLKADLVAGKVPSGQLPAYVDDVVEFANLAGFPITGESGKIYIAQNTGKSYRWTGSIYVVLQNDYALPPATATVLGGVKVGAGLGVALDGELYVVGGGGGGLPAFSEQFIIPVSNGQTVLTPAGGYTAGQIELLQNGVTLYGGGDDYTANDGTTITLTTGANTTDTFLLRKWVALSEPSVPEIVTRTGAQTLTNKTISGADNTLTADGTTAVGFRTIPQNSQSAGYTCTLDDSGKHILHPSADTTARTFTIPANISVAYPIGTAITFVNQASAGVVTISITTDTMRLAGSGTTGSRTLAANGVATAIKLTATEWIVSGTGLT